MNKKTLCSIYRRGAYAAYSARLAKRRKNRNLAKVLIEPSLLLFKEANSVFLEVSVEITDLFFSIYASISLLSVSKSAFACAN
jgi:hypothetical protein